MLKSQHSGCNIPPTSTEDELQWVMLPGWWQFSEFCWVYRLWGCNAPGFICWIWCYINCSISFTEVTYFLLYLFTSWLGRTCSKWPILCLVWRKIFSQSIDAVLWDNTKSICPGPVKPPVIRECSVLADCTGPHIH